MQSFSQITRLHHTGSKSETVLIQSYAQRYMKKIVSLLGDVPPELLLVFKTNDCLRHIDKLLGAPINTALGEKDSREIFVQYQV